MSQTEADRSWWEERRRLEVAQWRAWALELLRIPPEEAVCHRESAAHHQGVIHGSGKGQFSEGHWR